MASTFRDFTTVVAMSLLGIYQVDMDAGWKLVALSEAENIIMGSITV